MRHEDSNTVTRTPFPPTGSGFRSGLRAKLVGNQSIAGFSIENSDTSGRVHSLREEMESSDGERDRKGGILRKME